VVQNGGFPCAEKPRENGCWKLVAGHLRTFFV
jgi:hypothetical protein